MAVKIFDQRSHDSNRKTYKLAFPRDLEEERVAAWVRSISGTLRPSSFHLSGSPTVVFELWATHEGITHRIKVPWQHADYVVSQLRSLVPGVRVTPEDEYPHKHWTRAVEVGLSGKHRPLRIMSAADMSASLLASVQALGTDEALLVQWVMTPAIPSKPPVHERARSAEMRLEHFLHGNMADRDEINDRRAKLEEPNLLGVLRVGAVATTNERADHLIYRVRAALASSRGPSTRFVKRVVGAKTLQQRIDDAAGSFAFPVQLSVSEMSALIAWPIGSPNIQGLPPAMSRHLPANETVPRDGRVIGRSNMPGFERPIAVSYVDALKHLYVVGPTGVGKSTMLANMAKQDMERGHGVILMEAKGDLFEAVLDYVPPQRINDVVVLDVNDTKHPVGFNILRQGNDPRVVIDELSDLFDFMYKDTRGVWTREVLYHALRTLTVHPDLAFIDLAPLLVPMSSQETEWRDSIVRSAKDAELRNFWQRFENQPRAAQDRITQPVMDRIWQLNARPELRNIIGQSTSSFQMDDVIRGNKILLINLSGIAKETAGLTGTLLMNALWHSVRTVRPDKPNYLYLDEFQSFLNLPIDTEDMLAKARGLGLGMTLAHQHLAQLPTEMRQAVLANARTKVVFQTSADDARTMTREYGASVDDSDFLHLGKYEALARIATGSGVSAPVTMTTNEPAKGYNKGKQVKYVSRQQYGREVQEVEKEIDARRSPDRAPKPGRKSRLSGSDWGL